MLTIAVVFPFLFWIPGFFLAKSLLPNLNRLETTTLAVIISLALLATTLSGIEKLQHKITPQRTMVAVGSINLAALVVWSTRRRFFTKRREHPDSFER